MDRKVVIEKDRLIANTLQERQERIEIIIQG